MAVVINAGTDVTNAHGFWDNYNILTAIARIGPVVMRSSRFTALVLFFFSGLLFLTFGIGWVVLDFFSTWDWTGTFFKPAFEASQDTITNLAGQATGTAEGAAGGALAIRIVLQAFSMIPTVAELIGPFFAKYDKIVAALILGFSAFDYFTDWPKAASITANAQLTGWGALAPIVRFVLTAALCFFNSMGLQYLTIFFGMAWLFSAIVLLFGPQGGARRTVAA